MCGRYRFDDGRDDIELKGIIEALNRREDGVDIKTEGELRPTDVAPVLANSRRLEPVYFGMQWGYTLPDGRRIINARSETAAQKPLFRDGFRQRRCAVPAVNYYEWRHSGPRTKYVIRPADGGLFFMAGIYRLEADRPVFAILTRAPSEDVAFIHDRMPVILPRASVSAWLDPASDPQAILQSAVLHVVSTPEPAAQEQLRMALD